jgi:hypothetical protein
VGTESDTITEPPIVVDFGDGDDTEDDETYELWSEDWISGYE